MTVTALPATKPLCARCRSNPTLGALSVCKPCLKRQADVGRKEREKERRRARRAAP